MSVKISLLCRLLVKIFQQSVNININNLFTHVNVYEHKCSFKIRTSIKPTIIIKSSVKKMIIKIYVYIYI